jgi:Flp pilus assembly CpaE family ATPase
MTPTASALVVFDNRIDRGLIETLVTSDMRLNVHEFVDMDGHGPENDGAGDVIILACEEFTADVGDYVRAAARLHPGRPLLVLCSQAPNGHLGDVIAAGAEDILHVPPTVSPEAARGMSEQLVFAIHKALVRRRGAQAGASAKLAPMICVLGLKGGSGKTLSTCNLAVALAGAGARVAVVDVDLQFGDVGLALGLSPERTLYDLVRAGGSLDAEKLADFLTVHPSGARALLAPARPDQAGVVTAGFLKDVYALLRETHDFVIVDTPPSFTPEVIGAVDASSDVCLVAMLDSLSLKNSKLGLETLERMGYTGSVRVVLNRADSSVGITSADVCAIMGRTPDVLVPSDRMITRAVNQGEPIVALHSRSQAAKAYQVLARLYLADGVGPRGDTRARRERFRLVRKGR